MKLEIENLQKQASSTQQQYEQVNEEIERLRKANQEILEKARKEKEQAEKLFNRQEDEKKQNERFRQQIKEVERKIIEANQCAQFMHKNIKFSYQLVSVMPETFRLDSTPGDSSSAPRQEIQIKVHNGDTNAIYEWTLKTFQDKLEEIKDLMN